MSKTHTPGPWQAIEWTCHAPTTVVVDDDAVVTKKRVVADCDTTADARLIAAAPDLLVALEEMVKAFNVYAPKYGSGEYNCVIDARAAIAKATGEKQ